ncbi:type II toxin-antitoxin system RelE/ParE family toxin [Verminephrobacter eiseniae]|nr:type II toxin-antitoxin system RelE/ParE family toxin [Verminephrobacter eiseniae]
MVRSNHAMIHRIDDDGGTLTVLRVLHAARQWPAP